MLAVVLAILVKVAVILKLGLRNMSKRITSLIFLDIYTPLQQALTHRILLVKIIDKANSKFDVKIKEALHINWRKPNLNAQQNHLALTLSLYLLSPPPPPPCSLLSLFFLRFTFICYFHYL